METEDRIYNQPRHFIHHYDACFLVIGCGSCVEWVRDSTVCTERGPLLNVFAHAHSPPADLAVRGLCPFPGRDVVLLFCRAGVAAVARSEMETGGSVCASRVHFCTEQLHDVHVIGERQALLMFSERVVVSRMKMEAGRLTLTETASLKRPKSCRGLPAVSSRIVDHNSQMKTCLSLHTSADTALLYRAVFVNGKCAHHETFNIRDAIPEAVRKTWRDFSPSCLSVATSACLKKECTVTVVVSGELYCESSKEQCGFVVEFDFPDLLKEYAFTYSSSYLFDCSMDGVSDSVCLPRSSSFDAVPLALTADMYTQFHYIARGPSVHMCQPIVRDLSEDAVDTEPHPDKIVPLSHPHGALTLASLAGERITALLLLGMDRLVVGCESGRLVLVDARCATIELIESRKHTSTDFQPVRKLHIQSKVSACDWLCFDSEDRVIALSHKDRKLITHSNASKTFRCDAMQFPFYTVPHAVDEIEAWSTRFGYVLRRRGDNICFRAKDYHELSVLNLLPIDLYPESSPRKARSIYPLGKDLLIQDDNYDLLMHCIEGDLWNGQNRGKRFPLGQPGEMPKFKLQKASRLRRGTMSYVAILYSNGTLVRCRLDLTANYQMTLLPQSSPLPPSVDMHLNGKNVVSLVSESGVVTQSSMDKLEWDAGRTLRGESCCSFELWEREEGVERRALSFHMDTVTTNADLVLAAHVKKKSHHELELWSVPARARIASIRLHPQWNSPGLFSLALLLTPTYAHVAIQPRKHSGLVRIAYPLATVSSSPPRGLLLPAGGETETLLTLASQTFTLTLPGGKNTVSGILPECARPRLACVLSPGGDHFLYTVEAARPRFLVCMLVDATYSGTGGGAILLEMDDDIVSLHSERIGERLIAITKKHMCIILRDEVFVSYPLPAGVSGVSLARDSGAPALVDSEGGRVWRASHDDDRLRWHRVQCVDKVRCMDMYLAGERGGAAVVDVLLGDETGAMTFVRYDTGALLTRVAHHTAPVKAVRSFFRGALVVSVDGRHPVAVVHRRVQRGDAYAYEPLMRLAIGWSLDSHIDIMSDNSGSAPMWLRGVTSSGGYGERRLCVCEEKKWKEEGLRYVKERDNEKERRMK